MKKSALICLVLVLASANGSADLTNYLQADFGYAAKNDSIENIDAIYLINLDQRPEKLAQCLNQLTPYDINPYRFSAICGWDLPLTTICEVGLEYKPGMIEGKWAYHYSSDTGFVPHKELLEKQSKGKSFFANYMQPGAIGCALSHLSVLQNAYTCGYKAIWVMEDDVSVEGDPHELADLIIQLDKLIGSDGWDILYTDMDNGDHALFSQENDFVHNLKGHRYFWRPDRELFNQSCIGKRTVISEDFLKIGYRARAHSLVIRRSGIIKILDFLKKNHLFNPYDGELALIPGIRLVNMRKNLVTVRKGISDTTASQVNPFWEHFKGQVLGELSHLFDMEANEIAAKIMDIIYRKKPETCIELGTLNSVISYPAAKAVQFLKKGTFYAICDSDIEAAPESVGIDKSQKFKNNVNGQSLLNRSDLEKYCHLLVKCSSDAARLFASQSIDLLFIDGATSLKGGLEDITLYLPKIKEGGYIWVNRADDPYGANVISYLMHHCTWIKNESIENKCILFQKK